MSYEKVLIKDSSGKVVHTISEPYGEAIFGRDPKRSQIVFAPNARGVSRLHAVILWGEDFVQITDSSSHGTIVNDKKIVGDSMKLETGENLLKVGESDYSVIVEEKKKKKSFEETTQITSFFAQPSRKRKPESPVVLDLESQVIRGPARKKNVQQQRKFEKAVEVEENLEVIEIQEKSIRKFPRVQEDVEKSPELQEKSFRRFPKPAETTRVAETQEKSIRKFRRVQEDVEKSEDREKSFRSFPKPAETTRVAETQEKSFRKFPKASEVQEPYGIQEDLEISIRSFPKPAETQVKSTRKFPRASEVQEPYGIQEDLEISTTRFPKTAEKSTRKFPRASEVHELAENSEDLVTSVRIFPRSPEAQKEAENPEKSSRIFPRSSKSETPSRKREIPVESENPPKKSKIEETIIKKEEISPVNNRTFKKSTASNLTFFTNLIYENREKPEKSINNSTTAAGKVNFKRFKPKNANNITTIHRPTVPIKLVDFRKLKI
ncbi:unnamed protein product [Caenorhabditis angaria]|uniref:FHA domain-containing protein n=1 Tax=Caenorhabditis angaria TaxID=860376 RepID=A0A9P1IFX7_9PELO|nr:unnamed protein product [Caenorhabditis angaria]